MKHRILIRTTKMFITENEVYDIVEKSREGIIVSFNGLFLGFKDEIKQVVHNQIDAKVNGKIDAFRKENKEMYEELKGLIIDLKKEAMPVIEDRKTITSVGKFIMWIAGIGGAIIGLFKLIKL